MTADHPTREERYAAVLRSHAWRYGAYGLECTCGDELTSPHKSSRPTIEDHTAHVAAALVAADHAPVQPEAGLRDDEIDALVGDDVGYWLSNPFLTVDLLAAKVRWWITTAARAAQPVPAPEVSRGVAEVCWRGECRSGCYYTDCCSLVRDALPAEESS